MSKWIVQKPSILDPKQISHGFVVNDGEYAVPMGNSDTQLMVIHNGSPLKVCQETKHRPKLHQKASKTKKMIRLFKFLTALLSVQWLMAVSALTCDQ